MARQESDNLTLSFIALLVRASLPIVRAQISYIIRSDVWVGDSGGSRGGGRAIGAMAPSIAKLQKLNLNIEYNYFFCL